MLNLYKNFADFADILLPLVDSPEEDDINVLPCSPDDTTVSSPPSSPEVQYDIDPTDLALASIPG